MRNRLHNVTNPNQGKFPKVLCLCSAGLLRSPTIAWILSNEPFNCNTRAAGTNKSFALIPVDDVMIAWADIIVFVNEENLEECKWHHQEDLDDSATIVVLNLPDEFEFRDPQLVQIATAQLTEAFKDFGFFDD